MLIKKFGSRIKLGIFLICLNFIVLILSTFTSAQEDCTPHFNIFVDLVAKIRWTENNSIFQFNNFKENDILRVEKLQVYNRDNCTIRDMAISLKIKPENGYTYENKHPFNYNDFFFPIPDLEYGQIASIVINESYVYNYDIDGKPINMSYSNWAIDLDQTGIWIIELDIKNKRGNDFGWGGYNFRVNGNDIKWFRVISELDASLYLFNERTERLNRLMVAYTYIILALTVILTIFSYYSYTHSKSQEKQLNEIRSVLIEIRNNLRPKKGQRKK